MPKPQPKQPSSPPPTPTQTAKQKLVSITQLLHLTHHRNKNQHRLAKWYKHLSILRRNTQKLVSEVEALETAENFSIGGGKGERYVRDAREVVERRVEFMESWVVGSAYVAFSTVVKDLQYANLGLMLLGMLARIKSVIQRLGKEKSDEEGVGKGDEIRLDALVEVSREDEQMQDLGEVVRREELELISHEEERETEDEVAVMGKTPKVKQMNTEALTQLDGDNESPPKKKKNKEEKKKKKRKRGDAFDDMFDSLI